MVGVGDIDFLDALHVGVVFNSVEWRSRKEPRDSVRIVCHIRRMRVT